MHKLDVGKCSWNASCEDEPQHLTDVCNSKITLVVSTWQKKMGLCFLPENLREKDPSHVHPTQRLGADGKQPAWCICLHSRPVTDFNNTMTRGNICQLSLSSLWVWFHSDWSSKSHKKTQEKWEADKRKDAFRLFWRRSGSMGEGDVSSLALNRRSEGVPAWMTGSDSICRVYKWANTHPPDRSVSKQRGGRIMSRARKQSWHGPLRSSVGSYHNTAKSFNSEHTQCITKSTKQNNSSY